MRKGFEKQLEELNINLIKMGAMCECHIAETTEALFKGDNSYVLRSHELEEEIDKWEREIENICMGIFSASATWVCPKDEYCNQRSQKE